ncbi:helix-turn-helix domain-containing protein [Streptomyces goshikiensis]
MNKTELGAALRALRQASGKEAKAVARSAVMSTAKLSKIENGRVAPSVADVDRILSAVDVSAEVKAESMTLLRLFQPSLVPGLLQTPEYVRAVLQRKGLGEEQLSRTIGARIERQRVLYDTDKALRFIMTEPVLRWRILPAAMLAGQVDRIVSVSRLPNVDIRVVPLDAAQTDVPGRSFVIRDDQMVTVETTHAEMVVTDPRDVALYVDKFDRFSNVALSGSDMRAMLGRIRDELLREQETG